MGSLQVACGMRTGADPFCLLPGVTRPEQGRRRDSEGDAEELRLERGSLSPHLTPRPFCVPLCALA